MSTPPGSGRYSALIKSAAKWEEYILSALLLTMILLTCLQIILRSLFSGGLAWADPLVRYLVLWSGLLGAALATAHGKHIAIDLAAYLLPKGLRPAMETLCQLFSTLVSAGLVWASWLFLRSEMAFGGPGLLGIPSWGWNLIFPLAFSLICLRSAAQLVVGCRRLFQPPPAAPAEDNRQ